MSNVLPSDYQLLDYIESTGTQYIDTGIIGTTTLEVLTDMMWTDITGKSTLIGGYGGGGSYSSYSYDDEQRVLEDMLQKASPHEREVLDRMMRNIR